MSEQLETFEQSQEKLNLAFKQADSIIMRKYMPEISNFPVKEMSSDIADTNVNSILRINKIDKIVYDADENNLDKLMNVYNSVALCGGSLIHIILSDGNSVEYYIGTRTSNINGILTCQAVLTGTFEGNFPGSKLIQQDRKGLSNCLEKTFGSDAGNKSRIVSVVSGIPGLKNEDSKEFVQGMEKLIDSMAGRKYALITIAENVSEEQLVEIKESYEEIYTQLSPFAKITQTYSESDSSSLAENISDAVTESVGNTISKTTNQSFTTTNGNNSSNGLSLVFFSKNKGSNYSESKQKGSSYTDSQNSNRGITQTHGTTDTFTTTTGQTLQLVRDNKSVSTLLKKIDKQIERIEDAKDTGLWNTATYCIADDAQTSVSLAGTLQSLCRGKKTTVEKYSINTWTDEFKIKEIEGYLRKMIHPVFEMKVGEKKVDITPSSMISGNELAITAGLPYKSVTGVSISKMVPFARNIDVEKKLSGQNETINLGHIFHMGKEEVTDVELDVESLSAHMLITGSTGSGKSNTVYHIVSELKKKEKKFLIVEPAKGEYKNVFGNDIDVNVYGTNSKVTDLLKINPFSFPDEIHVLEHIDRLVEIFNVCWPMYAAMPAILKDAVLQAYQVCGWDLENSECAYDNVVYPSFKDVQNQIRNILNTSDYSEDNKGDYTGALVTRINSLTNGINGQIFTADEIKEQVLFDENTIIDLSRIGSQETKSLIMGLVIMKLNEYRMSCAKGLMNQKLKHITVLEEAHNLLKNTHASTTADGPDMAGKAVEMITNSIAEMRTYGEGFIIVDQSPNAIDISAVRNTNTKIIMRLPEENDRQQVGKSAAMTQKQISELARIPRGVAVVYQNNWGEPVLCKISKSELAQASYIYHKDSNKERIKDARKMLVMLLVGNRMDEYLDISTEVIYREIDSVNISTESKVIILDAINKLENNVEPSILKEESFEKLSEIVCEIIKFDGFKNLIVSLDEASGIQEQIHNRLKTVIGDVSVELELAVAQCIMRKMVTDNQEKVDIYAKWREYAVERRNKVE